MVTLNIVPVDDPPYTVDDDIRSQLIQGIGTVVPE